MESIVVKRHLGKSFTLDDIINFFINFNLFPLKGGYRQELTDSGKPSERGMMIFDTFKKTFFAHLHQTFNISEAMQEATE